MGGRFLGRPCPWRLIVDQLRALRRNCAVHHLSPSPVLPIRKAIANASTLRLPASERVPRATRRGSGHLLQPKSLGLRSTSHPVEPATSVDVTGFLGCSHATRSAAAAATPQGRNAVRPTGKGAAPRGLGGPFATPLRFGAWPGTPSPTQFYTRFGSDTCHSHGNRTRPLPGLAPPVVSAAVILTQVAD
jgi:hypothetical protein